MESQNSSLLSIFDARPDLKKFAKCFRSKGACWRCVLMLLRLSAKSIDLQVYRDHSHTSLDLYLEIEPNDSQCRVC